MRIITSFLLLVVLVQVSPAQKRGDLRHARSEVIAEAFYGGSGMAKIVGRYLVARVRRDRSVEFDDYKDGEGFVRRRSTVPDDLFAKLDQFLSERKSRDFAATYSAIYPTIDHTENLELRILIDGKYRALTVENFKPHIEKIRNAYPKMLIDLACLLESTRGSSEFVFFRTGNECLN